MALSFVDRTAVRQNIVPRCTGFVTNYALYLLGFPHGDGTLQGVVETAINARFIS